jgi:hypothetical protein
MWFEGAGSPIGIDEVWGMYLVSGFPHVVCIWVSLSFDEVLEHSGPAEMLVINDMLHFVFFFSLEEVR